MNLLQMGFLGSTLILCTAALRAVALHRLPKSLFLVLWEIAALRLLLPVSIPLPFSILPVPNLVEPHFSVPSGLVPASGGTAITATAPAHSQLLTILPALLWGAGALFLTAWFLRSYVRSMRTFRSSLPDRTPAVQSWLTKHPCLRPLEVRRSDRITSPLTYGILCPVILLPKIMDTGKEDTLYAVLTHEYIHIRRFDNAAKLLFTAALCLHWWNPLVWVLYVLANRDMELSCDAAVVRILGTASRASYALALIDLEETRAGCSCMQSYFSKNLITERIEAIMKFKKSSAAALAAAAMLTVVGTTATFASGNKTAVELDAPHKESPQIHSFQIDPGVLDQLRKEADARGEDFFEIPMDALAPLPDSQKPNSFEPVDDSQFPVVYLEETADEGSALSQESLSTDLPDQNVAKQDLKLISVRHSDESKFTSEEWDNILTQIEQGKVHWED